METKICQTDAETPMSFPATEKGEYIWTFTGKKFYFNDPMPAINIIDIAHHLSLICRWTGALREFYSVAEHCVRCSIYPRVWEEYCNQNRKDEDYHGVRWSEPSFPLRKLLHDAPEAWITDLNKPVKNVIGGKGSAYETLDDRITECIRIKYGMEPMGASESKAVKEADMALAMTEARDLLNQTSVAHYENARPLKNKISPWTPTQAEERFLERFKELM